MSSIKGIVVNVKAIARTRLGQQVGRFARIGAAAAVVSWMEGGQVTSKAAIWAAAVGGAEVAYRQWRQTVTASKPAVPADPAVTPGEQGS